MDTGSFSPLSNITPFTYRDGETYLGQLKRLRGWIDDIFIVLQGNINLVRSENTDAINRLTALLNLAIADFNDRWEQIENGAVVFDPTTGSKVDVDLALGHVFDNTRYYAYFAEQLDAFEYTAAQWDALDYSARHFDLALAYSPDAVQAVNVSPSLVTPN